MKSHDVADVRVGPEKAGYPWLSSYPKAIDWHDAPAPAPLYTLLDRAAAANPDNVCTNFKGRLLTYRQIAAQVDACAAGLQDLGIERGTRVGLLLPNSPTFIIYYYAILKAGGIVVNFNPLYTVSELAAQIRDSGTEIMVTLDLKVLFDKVEQLLVDGVLPRAIVSPFLSLLPGTKSALFKLFKSRELARPLASPATARIVLEADLAIPGTSPDPLTIDPVREIAVLQYTGGTTGTPKGAMLTHYNVYVNALQVAAWASPGETDDRRERVLGILPFFHVFAMTVVMNFAIAKAATIIIMPRFVLDEALKLIHRERPTVMPGVPTLFNAILNHPGLKSYDLSSLRFCIAGGAPLPVEVRHRFEELTGCRVVEGYGLSEASPVVTCNPVEGPIRDGSIGVPFPRTVVSLRDLSDPDQEVPPGEKGEVCVKGPQVMLGYWQKPDETRNVFTSDGYLRTGDVARMAPDGTFRIEDRIKDLIISSGYNVYPRQIEEAIYTHPDVEEVTVIGIPDDYRGEAPKAFVKLRVGASTSAEAILAHLEQRLSRIELPAEIEFRASLPKTMIGKLSKKELKAEELARRGLK